MPCARDASAADALIREGGTGVDDPDALFAAMLALGASDGVSGKVQLSSEGERYGEDDAGMTLVNLQQKRDKPTRRRRSRQLSVLIETISAEWKVVGSGNPFTTSVTGEQSIIFPGGLTFAERPSDGTAAHEP